MTKFLLALSVFLLWSNSAFAISAFLEPYVGFGKTQVRVKRTGGTQHNDIADGFMLGAKGGVNLTEQFFVGLDYMTAGPYNFGQDLNDAEWQIRMIGGGIGMDYQVIRFWAGYYVDDTIDDNKNQIRYKGDAIKIGFGLVVVKQLRANIELTFHNMKKANPAQVPASGGAATEDFKDFENLQSANVSISVPIDFK